MVRINIVGGKVNDPVDCDDGSSTEAAEKKLTGDFGKGILKQNGKLVLSEILTGNYEYHLTAQQVQPPQIGPVDDYQQYSGVQLNREHLPRRALVDALFQKFTENGVAHRFVYLASPPGTGKTSLLQLFAQTAQTRDETCIYVYMAGVVDLRMATGIDVITQTVAPGSVCADSTKLFVVLLDGAQATYKDKGFWERLVNGDVRNIPGRKLPPNIRFIIAANYSITTPDSPVDFATMPKLTFADLILSEAEVDVFLTQYATKLLERQHNKVARLLHHPSVRTLLAASCAGHIGALYVSARKLAEQFYKVDELSLEAVVDFYLSYATVNSFNRCFISEVTELQQDLRQLLMDCLRDKVLQRDEGSLVDERSKDSYRKLVRAGVLKTTVTAHGTKLVEFSSPIAAKYINGLIFPGRLRALVPPTSPTALMKSVLRAMSATTLEQSVVDPQQDFPPDAVFQHILMLGIHYQTPPSCCICPELSRFFPSATAPCGPGASGRCDFYLHGDLRWVLEVLVQGRGIGEHLARLESDDKYVGLRPLDHLVVDFRASENGAVTCVDRSAHRMTVFFKRGDYSRCAVLCGEEGEAETIELRA